MGATGRSENYRSSLAGVLGGVQGVVWIGGGGPEAAAVDSRLQRGRAAQRPGDEVPGTVLRGLDEVKTHTSTCPKLGGAVHVV